MGSIAVPNSTSWIAVRSASFAAQAYIASIVLGGWGNIEAAECFCRSLAPADQLGHARDGVGAVLVGEVGHELHRIAVEDHRLFAFVTEVDRHHLGIDRGPRGEPELLGDLTRHGELHRTRNLVAESVDELDGGRHASGVGVGLQTHGAQTRLLQDGRRGQAVVAGTHDDRVVIAHCPVLLVGYRGMSEYVSTDISLQGWDTLAGL